MAEFSGWNDAGMRWGSADALPLDFQWIGLEMFRQAILERCKGVYSVIYKAVTGSTPSEDAWKAGMLGSSANQILFSNEFKKLADLKTLIDAIDSQISRMLSVQIQYSNYSAFANTGAMSINDGQAASYNRTSWADTSTPFHVEGVQNPVRSNGGESWAEVPVSCDASIEGSTLHIQSVLAWTHSYGAPFTISMGFAPMTRALLISRTDADGLDWHSRLPIDKSPATLCKWFFQTYKMLNLLTAPACDGSIGYTTTIANGETVGNPEDYEEQVRSASIMVYGTYHEAYWSGMTDEDWATSSQVSSISEAWDRAQWVNQNGCGYAQHTKTGMGEDPNDYSQGYSEYAVRRRQWYKLMYANGGAFSNATVRAKQEALLQAYPFGGTYAAELGAENSWRQLIDATIPTPGGKSSRIEVGNFDGLPAMDGWQAEIVKVTLSSDITLANLLGDLKFKGN